jgi:hypothetical protein
MSLNDGHILDIPIPIGMDLHNHVSDDARGFRLRRIYRLDLVDEAG